MQKLSLGFKVYHVKEKKREEIPDPLTENCV